MSQQVKAGALAGVACGGVMIALAVWAGEIGVSLLGIVALAAPLLLAGVIFGSLIETGHLRLGFGPGITFWSVAFALSRFTQEGLLGFAGEGTGFAEGVIPFIVYQLLVGGAFGLGYLLLYQQFLTLLVNRSGELERSGGASAARNDSSEGR
ncbi:MAG: hypothetical protein ACRDKZ_07950 [Actinomycetota bacterium]